MLPEIGSFDNNEDESSPLKPSMYENLEDGIWNILMASMPRGYMVPLPRVGRRHTHHEKRQNMIPQPRLGRQLYIKEELAEIISEIQSLVNKGDLNPRYPQNKMKENLSSVILKDLIDNGVGNMASESTEVLQKTPFIRSFSSEESNGIPHFFQEEPTNKGHGIDVSKIDISNIPNKEESVSASEAMNSGIQLYDGEKRQGLIPLSRLGRARILTALDENLAASLMAYPRLDRRLWEMTKTLIPYPRAGRLVFDPEDYDIFLNVDYASPETEDSIADVLRSNQPVVKKRGQVKLIPRIGRKKRSISIDEKENDQHAEGNDKKVLLSDNDKSVLDSLDESETDYLFADDKRGTLSKSAFSPRIGKKRSEFFEDYIDDKRAAAFTPRIGRTASFTPRIGRAAAFTPRIGRDAAFTPRIGRAAAFTPRIGRAAAFTPRIGRALIPRIGRTDPRFRLRSRSSFIPRIGRRAALIPRVGRSENS